MESSLQEPTLMDTLVIFSTHWLVPMMVTLFFAAIFLRIVVYYTTKRQEWLSKEFEKRVDNFVEQKNPKAPTSFYVITKRLFEKTYYELFRIRYMMKRRKPDVLLTVGDRLFMVREGSAFFIQDILKPLKQIKLHDSSHPKLFSITKKSFARNPSFSKIFGLFPSATLNDVINILPGIFIILGVFGTFLGIMKALPDLGTMDLKDVDAAKATMDQFLIKISFSMTTSLVGIVLSVSMSFLNAALAPEKIFISAVDRMEAALDTLWHMSTDNNVTEDTTDFDDSRNPDEVLAEQALSEDVVLGKKNRSLKRVG